MKNKIKYIINIINIIIKRTFCIHRYQPISQSSFLSKDEKNKYDTWYELKCLKCGRKYTFKTYGKNLINSKKGDD